MPDKAVESRESRVEGRASPGPTLHLLEPLGPGAEWAPFDGVRPIAELRAGRWLMRERWERVLGTPAMSILGDHVEGFHEDGVPPVRPIGSVTGPAVVAAAWFAPVVGQSQGEWAKATRLTFEGDTVAWRIPAGATWSGPTDEGPAAEIQGVRLAGAYDLLRALEELLHGDCAADVETGTGVPAASIVLGDPALVIVHDGAMVEPGVVFDVRHGAVVLESGCEVRHGTRLEGPVAVDVGTIVLGGLVRGTAIGPHCRIRGEVSASVFLGYDNKAHDGFVGHSVVGRWVNLGAGTTTSNLKNTYGAVRLEAGGTRIETWRQFLGSLVADHAKTAIGTMLGTGTIVGVGANMFGERPVPKTVRPFSWGSDGKERQTEEGFLKTAERVMPRRGVTWTEETRESLRRVYKRMATG